MSLQQTLVFLKPDAIKRRLCGEIMSRFEKRGFIIRGMKLMRIPEDFARRHYAAHRDKDFFEPLVRYVSAGPSLLMVIEGKNAVETVRRMLGETFGSESPPGTIRGDFALSNRYNLVHGSDSPESADEEIKAFFQPGELVPHTDDDLQWIYDTTTGDTV